MTRILKINEKKFEKSMLFFVIGLAGLGLYLSYYNISTSYVSTIKIDDVNADVLCHDDLFADEDRCSRDSFFLLYDFIMIFVMEVFFCVMTFCYFNYEKKWISIQFFNPETKTGQLEKNE